MLGLLLAPSAVPAVELVMRDLVADALVRPTAFNFEFTTPAFTRSGNDGFKGGTALELGGRYSLSRIGDPFGLVVGLSATTESYSYDASDFMFTYGGRGSAGMGYALGDDWTLIGELGVLYGRTSLSLPASDAAPSFSANGTYRGYDGRLTCLYGITQRLLASLQFGYFSIAHDLSTGQGYGLTIGQKGPYVGLGLSWRFSNDPVHVK